jgi:hypothetical protein
MRKCIRALMLWILCVTYLDALCESGYAREGTTKTTQVAPTTVCEIVKNGAAFDGKYVSVHAFVVGGIPHGIALADDRCSGGLTMDAPDSVREHDDYLAFMRTIVEEGGGFTEKSQSRLVANFYGLLEYHPKEHQKWVLNVERISGLELKRNVR